MFLAWREFGGGPKELSELWPSNWKVIVLRGLCAAGTGPSLATTHTYLMCCFLRSCDQRQENRCPNWGRPGLPGGLLTQSWSSFPGGLFLMKAP